MYEDMLKWSIKEQIKYIRGFADGEGGPVMTRGRKIKNGKIYPQWDRRIKISNSNRKLLETIEQMLKNIGIKSKIYIEHKAGTGRCTMDCWALVILGKENIVKFGEIINFTEPRKQELIKTMISSYR